MASWINTVVLCILWSSILFGCDGQVLQVGFKLSYDSTWYEIKVKVYLHDIYAAKN